MLDVTGGQKPEAVTPTSLCVPICGTPLRVRCLSAVVAKILYHLEGTACCSVVCHYLAAPLTTVIILWRADPMLKWQTQEYMQQHWTVVLWTAGTLR